MEGPAFDELFGNMAGWLEALPHGRSTRYVTFLKTRRTDVFQGGVVGDFQVMSPDFQ